MPTTRDKPAAIDAPSHIEGENRRKVEIVRAAEYLFSRSSYDSVSIRDIAARAGVNSALVGYHFGPKEQLYRTLFERRYHGINRVRLAGLRELRLEQESLASLRAIAHIWTAPLLELVSDVENRDFVGLLAREACEAAEDRHGIFATYLDPSAKECMAAIKKVLPDADDRDVAQSYLWIVSTLIATITGSARLARLEKRRRKATVPSGRVADQLARFIASGVWAVLHSESAIARE